MGSVSMDMWQAFMISGEKIAPNTEIVYGEFHISKCLGDAVDKARGQKHRELKAEGNDRLTGLGQKLLFNEENAREDQQIDLQVWQKSDLRTRRAWALKENLRHLWGSDGEAAGKRFLDR